MTHALLLTDVVDSTQLVEQLGDAVMAAVWAAHDRVARDLLPLHRGREIDKTDGFLLLFDEASDAVAYALAYHRAIGALEPPLKARAGLHVGPVILRENPPEQVARGAKPLEVEGLAKPVAARIMGLALGGQTLLSEDARSALGRAGHRLESHGHWRMKGVSEPVEVFEVGDAGAPFTPPSDGAKVYRVVRDGELWLPVRQVKHSLPAERDAFVGRSADLQELARRLDGSRLVSVLGIGGTGKTRLVTRYGWTWLGDWPGGVWFCDLSEARSDDGIVAAVARALDVPLAKDHPVVQLGHAIAGRGRCLVILDNFEQVARHAGDTLGRWLDRANEASFVVTTREVLGLPGETALALAPLVAAESVALFAARAAQAKRDFTLSDADRADVKALVKLLDGLPLAIELAAARVRVMPPKTVLARMSERFKLLASSGGRHTRQATLRGALDWSWDLLSGDEQRALAQLSVFEGGFTLEAAEAVLALDEQWPMDAVQALVDKSLVRQVSDTRFDLLVSVQVYGAERLRERGEVADSEARHGRWVSGLREPLGTEGSAARARALAAELDNVVVACRRAVTRGDAAVAVAAVEAAYEVLGTSGPISAALDLPEVVARMDLSGKERARAERCWGIALRDAGRKDEARPHLERALELARELGDRAFEGIVFGNLGFVPQDQGRFDEARAHYEGAIAIAREVGDRRFEGMLLTNLGVLHADHGRMDEARAVYERALALHREVGNRRSEGRVLGNLGRLLADQGRMDEARALYESALEVAREVGNRRSEVSTLTLLGGLRWALGQTHDACAHFERALAVAREVGDRQMEGVIVGDLGAMHASEGRLDEARAHYDRALDIHREVGGRRAEVTVLGNLGVLNASQGRVDEARATFEEALAVSRELGDRRQEGHVLSNLGRLLDEVHRPDEARAYYESARAIAREIANRSSEGWILTQLARHHLSAGELSAAAAQLDVAEPLLRELADPALLASALAARAEVLHRAGRPEAARATLAEAEAIAPEGRADSAAHITRARALLAGGDA